jgi:hypothetical protein
MHCDKQRLGDLSLESNRTRVEACIQEGGPSLLRVFDRFCVEPN